MRHGQGLAAELSGLRVKSGIFEQLFFDALHCPQQFRFNGHGGALQGFRQALSAEFNAVCGIDVVHLRERILSGRFVCKEVRARPPQRKKVHVRNDCFFRGTFQNPNSKNVLAYGR